MQARLTGALFILAMAGATPAHAGQAHGCMVTIDLSRWSPGACTAGTISYSARLEKSGDRTNASADKTGDVQSREEMAPKNPTIRETPTISTKEQLISERLERDDIDDPKLELNRGFRSIRVMISEIKSLPDDESSYARLDEMSTQLERDRIGSSADAYQMAREAIESKRNAIKKLTSEAYIRKVELAHVQDVDNLSLANEYLDATIILETSFGNAPWITMRQWLSQLFDEGYHVETVSSYDIDAQGISIKKQGARAQAIFFEQEDDELYLSYAGEGRNVFPLSPRDRQKLSFQLRFTVK